MINLVLSTFKMEFALLFFVIQLVVAEEEMNTAHLIRYYGYPVEAHDLFTPDDYLIRIFRIPYGIRGSGQWSGPVVNGHPVVFLLHGLPTSSDRWVESDPDESLGFVLADLGFDVWLGNVRGNTYGRRHKHLDPDHDMAFWDFTFDENGGLDLPTMLRFALEKSGKSKLQLVALSLGTATSFAMLSSMDEFNTKIRMYHAFAPIIRNDLCVNASQQLFVRFRHPVFVPVLNTALHGELLSYKDYKKDPIGSEIIATLCGLSIGAAEESVEESAATDPKKPRARIPAGSSVLTIDHVWQGIEMHQFTKYKYIHEATNVQKYGSSDPPAYVLPDVDVPVILYYSRGDSVVCVKAVKALKSMLRSEIVRGVLEIGDENFSHGDFVGKGDTRVTMKIFIDRLVEHAHDKSWLSIDVSVLQ